MKHAKPPISKRKKRKRRLKVLFVLFIIALALAALTIYRDYNARPGFLEKVWISERGADFITVAWEKPRNVSKYVITYGGESVKVSGRRSKAKITGLKEDTQYIFSVRADSREREGFETISASARTKKFSHITSAESYTKFANRTVDLKLTAETPVTILSGTGYTVTDEGKVIFTKSGSINVSAKTDETEEYASVSKEIPVEVLDTINVDNNGVPLHIFYKLNPENCERLKTIEGAEEAVTPQAFARYEGKYIITYIKKDTQRIITYGDEKKVYEPEQPLGHANGLTIANGKCYLVEGYSAKCTTFDPPNSNYSSFNLPASTSGIAYDDINNLFYASARKELTVYDTNFSVVRKLPLVNRTEDFYVQDCTAFGDIMMHCISGKDFRGINYIDLYNMTDNKYLGSIECDLDELESIIVDEEGYIELLSNAEGITDYIWKTPLNMKALCE